ncbi:MAG: hypothetical protein WAN04_01920, partial [Candidatus Udaeobacter sp.]
IAKSRSASQFKVRLKAEFQGNNHDRRSDGSNCGNQREMSHFVIVIVLAIEILISITITITSMSVNKRKSCSEHRRA